MLKDYLPDLYVLDITDFDSDNTILIANTRHQPISLTVGVNTLVGRAAAGGINDLSAADVRTILNVANGADVTGSENVAAALLLADIKSTLANADNFFIADSEQTNALKQINWTNLKTNISTFYNSLTATISNKTFNNSSYVYYDNGNSGSSKTIDYSRGAHQRLAVSEACSLNFDNWPTSGSLGELVVELVNGGAYTIVWPTIYWIRSLDGSVTTQFSESGIVLQESGTDWCFFWSRDGGSTIYGKVVR